MTGNYLDVVEGINLSKSRAGVRGSRISQTQDRVNKFQRILNITDAKNKFYKELHLDKESQKALNCYRDIKKAILGIG